MASSHAALVEAYLGPLDAASFAPRATSFSAASDPSAAKFMMPALEAFSPRLQYAAPDSSSIRSAREAGPRKAPLSYAELAPYSARQSSRLPPDYEPSVGSRVPSSVVKISGKSRGHGWSGNETVPVRLDGGNRKSLAMDSASAYGEYELQVTGRGRSSHLGSEGTEITHATTPSWRSRSFPPAIDPATSMPVTSMPSASIQTAPRRRLPPLPDEARQAKPYSAPSEIRHLDRIDSAVHEANAMLVESFLNVKRRMTSDHGSPASGSMSYASSAAQTPSIVSHAASARGMGVDMPKTPRYVDRRPGLAPVAELSDVSRSTMRNSLQY
mmetsp:Transcript_110532/g.195736  ORF Transcript_110532/g.195736 Transcript_110532/m.195736 type:complete len:327 (-) Transcript_110532:11-991(-)